MRRLADILRYAEDRGVGFVCDLFGGVLRVCSRRRAGGERQHQRGGEREAQNGGLFKFHDGEYPFFGGVRAKSRIQRGQGAPFFLHRQQRAGVGSALAFAEAAKHRLVAGKLDIAVGEDVHEPHGGVEPMDGERRRERQLERRVQPPRVDVFVLQRVARRLVREIEALRHKDHGPQHAIGQRRVDAIQRPDRQRPAERVRVEPCRRGFVLNGNGAAKALIIDHV